MRFVFKEKEPFFFRSVHVNGNDNRAGVDFVGLIQILQLPCRFEFLHGKCRHVHQSLRPVGAHECMRLCIDFISLAHRCRKGTAGKVDMREFRHKRRMTAMVGPIRVDNANFRNRRISFFFVPEIISAKSKIRAAHGKPQAAAQLCQSRVVHSRKAFDAFHVGRPLPRDIQRRCRRQRRFPRFDGIDAVLLNGLFVGSGEGTRKNKDPCCTHDGLAFHGQHLKALHG